MDRTGIRQHYDRFDREIDEEIARFPNPDDNMTNDWYLDINPSEPHLHEIERIVTRGEAEDVRYAYHDINDDGIDELFVAWFREEELLTHAIDVYLTIDGAILRGEVGINYDGELEKWRFTDLVIDQTVDSGTVLEGLYIGIHGSCRGGS